MRRRALFIALGLALLAPVVLGGCGAREPEGWSADQTYRYDVRVSSRSTVGGSDRASEFTFDLSAQLEVTPLAADGASGTQQLALTFRDVALTGSGDAQAKERFARVARELEQPSIVRYAGGAMTEAELGKSFEALTIGIVRNVAGALQLPVLSGAAVTAHEYDATGRYTAKYEPRGGDGAYRKTKLAYESLIIDAALQTSLFDREVPPPTIAASTGELKLSNGRLASLASRERLELPLVASSAIATETTLALEAIGSAPAKPIDRGALASTTERLLASAPYRSATTRFDFNAIKIGGRGFDELLAMLEALAKQRDELRPYETDPDQPSSPEREREIKRWSGEQNRALTAMATLLRTEPELTDRTTTAIRGKSPAHKALITALGAAGTEQAQAALLEIMRDGTEDDDSRNAAGLALIRTKTPSDAAVRALEGLLEDPHWHQYAVLGLGTYARLLGEQGRRDEHQRLGELLLARLRATDSAYPKSDVLSALSNSGYAGMIGPLAEYLSAKDDATRDQATRALRLVKHPDVARIALDKLGDVNALVRTSALEIVENLGASEALGRAVQARALKDDDGNVRLRALQLLIAWKDQLPQVRATIQQVASADPSEPIRQVAQRAIPSKG